MSALLTVLNNSDDNKIDGKNDNIRITSQSSHNGYNEYSSKYTESMDFVNVKKTFNTYHSLTLTYGQLKEKNPQYKSAVLSFFKDLDATLTTIGCVNYDKKRFFMECKQYICNKMINQINIVKHQYEYLCKISCITGPITISIDELNSKYNNNYWKYLMNASFITKLKYSYDKWMINNKINKKSETEFKNEISGVLHINPIYIKINGVGKGLNDIVIDWEVLYIWIPFYIQGIVQTNLIYREYEIKPQDQIEVKYKDKWIPCTIIRIHNIPSINGSKIKIRYNKLNGVDRFKVKNVEWVWTKKDYYRLHLPNYVYVIVSYNGVRIGCTFKPPLLAQIKNNNLNLLDIGHHIFVNRNDIWYRCEIIESALNNKKIKILYLVNTFNMFYNTEWLRLWEPMDRQRISLKDMRT